MGEFEKTFIRKALESIYEEYGSDDLDKQFEKFLKEATEIYPKSDESYLRTVALIKALLSQYGDTIRHYRISEDPKYCDSEPDRLTFEVVCDYGS